MLVLSELQCLICTCFMKPLYLYVVALSPSLLMRSHKTVFKDWFNLTMVCGQLEVKNWLQSSLLWGHFVFSFLLLCLYTRPQPIDFHLPGLNTDWEAGIWSAEEGGFGRGLVSSPAVSSSAETRWGANGWQVSFGLANQLLVANLPDRVEAESLW